MGLFDVFTGAPAKKAGEQTRNYLSGVQNQTGGLINSNLERGIDYSQAGTGGALNYLSSYFPTARNDVANATASGINSLEGYANSARAAFDQQSGVYDPIMAQGQAGADMYGNLLGLNGAGGTAAANAAFQASPAYTFNLGQGLEAINRRRAAAGELAGGNADRDAQTFGAGQASQEINRWGDRLAGYLPLEVQAAQGQAAGLANRGNLMATTGAREADLITTGGRSLADLASRQGLAGAQINQGGGQNLASLLQGASGLNTSLALGIAQPYAKTYSDEANAQMQGSKNLWDFAMNGAKAAAGSGFFGGGGAGAGSFGGASGSPYSAGAGGYAGMGPFI